MPDAVLLYTGLAKASLARNPRRALYVAERATATIDAIPTILTGSLLGLLVAVPFSPWIKVRIAAGASGTG